MLRPVSTWLALLPLLAACGAERIDTVRQPLAANGSTIQIRATAVTATATGLAIEVEVPVGAPGCGSDPEAEVTARDRRTVWVSTTATAVLGPACDGVELSRVTVEVSVRGRRLAVNDEQWELDRGAIYVRCGSRGCDPPTDRCDPTWTADLGVTADLPTERDLDVLVCDPPWLVADLSAALAGCVPLEGEAAPAGCTAHERRWFARLEAGTWQVVASGTAAGCEEVLRQVPEFPGHLCRGLGPLP